ncbi:nuclear transport factor 2 family protein [Flavobacterium hauense]
MKTILRIATLFVAMATHAQNEIYPENTAVLTEKIIALDAEAFDAYNTCDLEKVKTFFTNDLEFYHDKGGYSKGLDKFSETMKNNICNDQHRKIIRKPVIKTFKVYPLDGYGAILIGEHDFYSAENGKETKTGTAKFTHVWLLKDGYWKMARVLSYDHKAAQ